MAQTELQRGKNGTDSINANIAANLATTAITGGTIDGVAITGGTVSGLDTDLAVADGGTASSTAPTARTALGVSAKVNATNVVGTESTNVINVAIQLKDAEAVNLAARHMALVYLSDDANGDGLTASAPATSVAIGTDGTIIETITAKSSFHILSNATGAIDLDITDTTGSTWYLIVVLDDGSIFASDAITFTT